MTIALFLQNTKSMYPRSLVFCVLRKFTSRLESLKLSRSRQGLCLHSTSVDRVRCRAFQRPELIYKLQKGSQCKPSCGLILRLLRCLLSQNKMHVSCIRPRMLFQAHKKARHGLLKKSAGRNADLVFWRSIRSRLPANPHPSHYSAFPPCRLCKRMEHGLQQTAEYKLCRGTFRPPPLHKRCPPMTHTSK